MAVYALKPAEPAKGYGQTKSLREKFDDRFASLKTERGRDNREHEWRLIKKYIMPRRGRFDGDRKTAGREQSKAILNNVASQSLRTMANGMAANVISPALPWFRLAPDDDDKAERGPVREWLDIVERKARMILAASGFYQAATASLYEVGGFGTTALGSTRDFENVFSWQPWTCGTYYVATDASNRPRTVYREIQLTIEQMVGEFGENCSREVLDQYDRGDVDKLRTIRHAIEPFNDRRFAGQTGLQQWRYIAGYWDPTDPDRERFLKLGGHKTCPVHVFRWDFCPPDAYGNSPCMEALGDITGLQRVETRLAQGVEKKAAPAMQGPPLGSLADGSFNPFDLSPHAYNAVPGLADIRPLVDPRAIVLTDAQWFWEMLNNRIKETLYVSLFQMLETLDRAQITATEIMARQGEKLLQLGPVLTNMNYEWLDPTLDNVTDTIFSASLPFWQRGEAGMVPPPPEELQGSELQISYISALQQAQQATRAQPIHQLMAFVGQYAQLDPDMTDKVDFDQAIDELASALGVPPKVVRDDDTTGAIREGKAQAAAQAQQMAQQQQGAEVANKLGNASVAPDTALGAMMQGAG
jgi:hypothetical protein